MIVKLKQSGLYGKVLAENGNKLLIRIYSINETVEVERKQVKEAPKTISEEKLVYMSKRLIVEKKFKKGREKQEKKFVTKVSIQMDDFNMDTTGSPEVDKLVGDYRNKRRNKTSFTDQIIIKLLNEELG